FDTCSCQTARCFNKSKGVLITGLKLKAFRNPQPSWGFSVHKKNLRIRAGWCKRQGTKSVPNNLTNQYLWDLDCGLHDDSSPARKRKGMKGNATRCVNCRLLLQIDDRPKKTCASAQAGVIHVLNPKLTSPINTSGITTLAT
ncbi:hypothetical protein, partial [Escherichia coli]|uniref:hypothetical protein n=3 Tax=Escherichia coli TaxID=562 RepID=UPI00197AB646